MDSSENQLLQFDISSNNLQFDSSGVNLQKIQFGIAMYEIENLLYSLNKVYYDKIKDYLNEDKFKWLVSLLMIFPLSENEVIVKIRKDLTLLCLVYHPRFYIENRFSDEQLLEINFLRENLFLINKSLMTNTVFEPYTTEDSGKYYTFNPEEELVILRDKLTSSLEKIIN